jgi:hypothetical protein
VFQSVSQDVSVYENEREREREKEKVWKRKIGKTVVVLRNEENYFSFKIK